MGLVLERLLQEADRFVKDLLEGWEDERSMKRKVCHSYPTYAYLDVANSLLHPAQ